MRYLVSVFTFLFIPFSFLSAEISPEIDFDAKMENFDANVVEIGQYINKLYNINDLELGMTVEVIFNKGVMESDPVQGTAKVIKVINE